jgi:hypothetical protein
MFCGASALKNYFPASNGRDPGELAKARGMTRSTFKTTGRMNWFTSARRP